MEKLIITLILGLIFSNCASVSNEKSIAKDDIQLQLKQVLSNAQQEIQAKQIMVVIMNSKTGEIVYQIDSNHEDASINDISNFVYQPGGIIKPITLALVLDKNLVKIDDKINVHNGYYNIGNKVILDKKKFGTLSVEDIIIQSSNIGIIKLAQKLDAVEFHDGLLKFGFSEKLIPSSKKLNSEIFKATTSYGYGMKSNLVQLVKAYSLFNDAKHSVVITNDTAEKIQKILIKTVNKGIAKNAYVDGLTIGGELGSSHIIENGHYAKKYNSTFIGFVNDSMNIKYTIGVLVREAKHTNSPSQVATLVFNKLVTNMLKNGHFKN